MSTGTKQIRSGKIVKVIEELKFRLGIFEDMNSRPTDDYTRGSLQGKILELEKVLELLEKVIE